MKKYFYFLCLVILSIASHAQSENNGKVFTRSITLTDETIVKDTSGQVLPSNIWRQLHASGDYGLKPLNMNDANTQFVIFRYTETQKKNIEAARLNLPKPKESNFFRVGEKFSKINTRDLYGNKINSKNLKRKILVINYWFTNCGPCVHEMPELNKMVNKYANDSSIVFISIALDDASTLENFLKTHPFNYKIIDNGQFLARDNGIKSYPTNLVVDRNGKVFFHTSGYSLNTVSWIEKSIEEIKANEAETIN